MATAGTKRRRGGDDRAASAPVAERYASAGRRCVRPYVHIFRSFVKARWEGRGLVEVFSAEFASHSPAYFLAAVEAGAITVDSRPVPASHILRSGELIEHHVHVHEPPVPETPLLVIPTTTALTAGAALPVAVLSDLIVVCKPAGIPVHACGAFRHNTLISLLVAEAGLRAPLHAVHRLDRLTSGLIILASSANAAREMGRQLRDRAVRKRYIARVAGEFPAAPTSTTAAGSDSGGPLQLTSESLLDLDWQAGPSNPPDTLPQCNPGSADVAGLELNWDPAGRGTGTLPPPSGSSSSGGKDASVTWSPCGRWLVVNIGLATVDHKQGLHGPVRGALLLPTASGGGGGGASDDEDDVGAPGASSCQAGRPSVTLFRRLRTVRNAGGAVHSVVEARPLTGRTHQIRVHLAWLGFPIVDDPLYCAEARAALAALAAARESAAAAAAAAASSAVGGAAVAAAAAVPLAASGASAGEAVDVAAAAARRLCRSCADGSSDLVELSPTQAFCHSVALHSCTYEGPGWRFDCPTAMLPAWASAPELRV